MSDLLLIIGVVCVAVLLFKNLWSGGGKPKGKGPDSTEDFRKSNRISSSDEY